MLFVEVSCRKCYRAVCLVFPFAFLFAHGVAIDRLRLLEHGRFCIGGRPNSAAECSVRRRRENLGAHLWVSVHLALACKVRVGGAESHQQHVPGKCAFDSDGRRGGPRVRTRHRIGISRRCVQASFAATHSGFIRSCLFHARKLCNENPWCQQM